MTSHQLPLFISEDFSRLAAIKLIEAYVRRGDSIEDIKKGMLGHSSPNGIRASISGYLNDKRYGSDTIIVYRDVNGDEVNHTFKLSDIVKMIKESS